MNAARNDDENLTQKEAAHVLRVSVSYLRASDCPKILLPPTRGERPLVRYRRSTILQWSAQWETGRDDEDDQESNGAGTLMVTPIAPPTRRRHRAVA